MKLFKNFKTRKQLKNEIERLEFLLTGKDAKINYLQNSLVRFTTCDIVRLKADYSIIDLFSITDKDYATEQIHSMIYTKIFEIVKDYIVITENTNIGPYGEIIQYVAELDVVKR